MLDITPARFAGGYMAFLEHSHASGAERILDPARLDAYRLVLGWFAHQETMTEQRFRELLCDRAHDAADAATRWICTYVLQFWSLSGPRRAYAGPWADGDGAGTGPGAPWGQPPGS